MVTQKVNAYLSSLGSTPEYQDLFSQIEQLSKMQQAFSTIAPAYLVGWYTLGPFYNGKITIFVRNGSIATKLKQISPSLLLKLQKLGWEVTAIQITVQAHYYTQNDANSSNNASQKKKLQLSQVGINNLSQLAMTLPHSELKHSIELLINKHQKN